MRTQTPHPRTHGLLKAVRLLSLLESLRASFWLLPLAFIAGAMGLGVLLPWLDHSVHGRSAAWYLYAGQPESARALLSTIATSMLSLAGLVFSITILVLQLASSQFSPRVLRTFMSDRTTQISMGVFLGCFVYAMMLLPQVTGNGLEHGFVPALAVFVAFALTLMSVVMFVRYIHHMAHSIRAVHVMRLVAERGHETLADLYPEVGVDDLPCAQSHPTRPTDQSIESERAGIITALDDVELMRLACEHEAVMVFARRIGDFVPRGAPLFSIWIRQKIDPQAIRECVVLGNERTPQQDATFALRQLVDVAERALSPGINDPTTAVQALDCIHDLLRSLARRKIPIPERLDEHGQLRLILPCPTWTDYVHLGLDEIRQYAGRSIQVMRRLRVLLDDLLSVVDAERAEPLHEQLRFIELELARNFSDPRERELARPLRAAE